MKFDQESKVIIETLNPSEARAFVLFLKSEIARYQMDIDNAYGLCYSIINKFKLSNMWED